jgi:hypothetical protein
MAWAIRLQVARVTRVAIVLMGVYMAVKECKYYG